MAFYYKYFKLEIARGAIKVPRKSLINSFNVVDGQNTVASTVTFCTIIENNRDPIDIFWTTEQNYTF